MKSRSSKFLAATFAAGLALALLPATLGAQDQVDKDAFRRISDRLICQCGCNYGLSHCPHLQCPSAPKLRALIRDKLAAGQSEPEIIQAMVADFGPAILAAPPAHGFNLTAWVMPFAALLLGLWVAQHVLRRWRRRPQTPAADPTLVDRYRSRVEKEMRNLEE